MSYFLFGSFNSTYDKELLQQVKVYANKKNIYIWFSEEITFYKEIQRMLEEQKSDGNIKQCCRDNINILFDCLKNLINLLHIRQAEIFVVERYDDIFRKKVCSIDKLKQDLLCQIEDKVSIESCIYRVSS